MEHKAHYLTFLFAFLFGILKAEPKDTLPAPALRAIEIGAGALHGHTAFRGEDINAASLAYMQGRAAGAFSAFIGAEMGYSAGRYGATGYSAAEDMFIMATYTLKEIRFSVPLRLCYRPFHQAAGGARGIQFSLEAAPGLHGITFSPLPAEYAVWLNNTISGKEIMLGDNYSSANRNLTASFPDRDSRKTILPALWLHAGAGYQFYPGRPQGPYIAWTIGTAVGGVPEVGGRVRILAIRMGEQEKALSGALQWLESRDVMLSTLVRLGYRF